jgi:hypothetical protein
MQLIYLGMALVEPRIFWSLSVALNRLVDRSYIKAPALKAVSNPKSEFKPSPLADQGAQSTQ